MEHLIGLLLGTEDDWPTAFETLVSKLGPIKDASGATIAEAIITLGHSLGLKVIAEGVETGDQLDFLRRKLCDEFQGYYFSRPVPATEVVRHMRVLTLA